MILIDLLENITWTRKCLKNLIFISILVAKMVTGTYGHIEINFISAYCVMFFKKIHFGFTYNVPCHINVTSLQNIVWETVIITQKFLFLSITICPIFLKIVFRHILDIFEGSMSLCVSSEVHFPIYKNRIGALICNRDFFRIYTKLVFFGWCCVSKQIHFVGVY